MVNEKRSLRCGPSTGFVFLSRVDPCGACYSSAYGGQLGPSVSDRALISSLTCFNTAPLMFKNACPSSPACVWCLESDPQGHMASKVALGIHGDYFLFGVRQVTEPPLAQTLQVTHLLWKSRVQRPAAPEALGCQNGASAPCLGEH